MPDNDTADNNESNNVKESQDSLVAGQSESGGILTQAI